MDFQPTSQSASCVREVFSFDELQSVRFNGVVNALCWRRDFEGDFSEVAAKLSVDPGITPLSAELLRGLKLSSAGRKAVDVMLQDVNRLEMLGLQPALECVHGYVQDQDHGLLRTDVCSWHVDSATCEADTWLCTYFGASTEGLPNTQAIKQVDVPETRSRLLSAYGGSDEMEFREWLTDHCYDLHYTPLPGALPYRFGQGHLWRVATLHDTCAVLPCIHRAPTPESGGKRLLLIC